jgi:hypothetical protein
MSRFEESMRRLLFVCLSAFALLCGAGTNHAYADRYCLQGPDWGYPGNCSFSSYRQCVASATGTNAHCGANPSYTHQRRAKGH